MSYLSRVSPDVRRVFLARYIAQAAEDAAKQELDEKGGIWRQLGTPAAPDLANPSQTDRRIELERTLMLLRDPYYMERQRLEGMIGLVEIRLNPSNSTILMPLLRKYQRALADLPK